VGGLEASTTGQVAQRERERESVENKRLGSRGAENQWLDSTMERHGHGKRKSVALARILARSTWPGVESACHRGQAQHKP
jgi:hypothetical protein